MPQFFIDKKIALGEEALLTGREARHISQSLRLKKGDWICLSDGEGRSFRATITHLSETKVTALIEEEMRRIEKAPPPVLALALIKADRFEWAVQKAVELGCRRILPFQSARTVQKCAEKKLARWRKIAMEAAKQSGLPFRPIIDEIKNFDELLFQSSEFGRTILFYEGEKERPLSSLWESPLLRKQDLIITGPEGGFDKKEVGLAREAGAMSVSLGVQILRVETAAIAALTIWQYELGNMDI